NDDSCLDCGAELTIDESINDMKRMDELTQELRISDTKCDSRFGIPNIVFMCQNPIQCKDGQNHFNKGVESTGEGRSYLITWLEGSQN
ncbi:hypothetical protein LCGC14_2715450, partial [marine sediment metagenome]